MMSIRQYEANKRVGSPIRHANAKSQAEPSPKEDNDLCSVELGGYSALGDGREQYSQQGTLYCLTALCE